RFDLLNLENNRKLYIPVSASSSASSPHQTNQTQTHHNNAAQHAAPTLPHTTVTRPGESPVRDDYREDYMQIEDTPHRIYIHDLDAELASDASSSDSSSDTPIFLPDIEKHLTKIPHHLLQGQEPTNSLQNQLVLYRVPESLTVPAERDSVRKAIVEARERARERQSVGGVLVSDFRKDSMQERPVYDHAGQEREEDTAHGEWDDDAMEIG
ncbi:hypothetical protein LTS18_002755, partial [Coniosporium uncinatum]